MAAKLSAAMKLSDLKTRQTPVARERCTTSNFATLGVFGIEYVKRRPLANAGKVSAAELTDRKGDFLFRTMAHFYGNYQTSLKTKVIQLCGRLPSTERRKCRPL